MLINSFTVQSPNVTYTDTHIESKYTCVSRPALYLFHTDATSCFPGTRTLSSDLKIVAMAARSGLFIPWSLLSSSRRTVESRSSGMSLSATQRATVSRPNQPILFLCRIMLVGLGGNNGTTLVGGVIANREGITWKTKEGIRAPDYYGSLTQSSTCRVGTVNGQEIFTPFKALLPMVDPDHIVFDGWDISGMNLADAMERSKVFEWDLQRQLAPHLRKISPRPGIFDPSFIAANQGSRADNFIKGTKKQQMHRIRADIRDFKEKKSGRQSCCTLDSKHREV